MKQILSNAHRASGGMHESLFHTRAAWAAIFRFEIRYHLGQPLFYLVTFFLSVLLFMAGTGHGPASAVGRLHLNAPAMILQLLVKGIVLVLFMMTAFVINAAVRDFDRRTSELFFSMPISRFDYLIGRFAGTMVVCMLAYLVGATALAASTFMPSIDSARLGPFRLAPYAFGLGVLVFPTLLALGGVFFALASWTRSTIATYVGVVAFFAVNAIAGIAASHLETKWIAQLLDPFAGAALSGVIEYWPVTELNTAIPELSGMLLWNRIFWLILGLTTLGLAVVTFNPSRSRTRRDRNGDAPDGCAPTAAATIPEARGFQPQTTRRVFSLHSVLVQFLRRVRHETTTVLGNLAFLGILAFALSVLIQEASSAGSLFGMPVHPRTYLMLEAMRSGYSIILLLVVVLYSGELVWKERALEMEQIHDSMPTPSAVYFGAKLTALLLVIAVLLFAGVLALVGFQLWHGYTDLELDQYAWGVALTAVYPILMMVFACFCHVVASSRIAGYGLVILFIISWDLIGEEFGFEHHLYRFASLPPIAYSDLNGYGPLLAPFGWYSLYWGFGALVLVGISILFWKRGTDDSWKGRWIEARLRFRGSVRTVTAVGAFGLAATGSWIFYNTNVVNEYVPSTAAAEAKASYERRYRQYQNLDLPRIITVRADVDIFPERRSVGIRGTYRIRNNSVEPLRDIHVSIPERVQMNRIDLPAHELLLDDAELGYRIYRLRDPLEPGEISEFSFDLTVENRGFVNNGTQVAVTGNGTFFTKRDFFPVIGYDAQRQLADPDERRKRGLAPVLRLPNIGDLAARRNTPRASDADWIDFETTVSTSTDQIAVTSGELQREWIADGRRYFHYRSEVPITHFFAYASARYEVTRGKWNDVAIEVYHHPEHDNVDRMIDSARKSLAYFSANFGPYQHRHLRIVEFPGYVRDGTAFPGMTGLSEAMGFNARLNGKEAVDYPFYVTAHEVAHEWWGQQLVGANVKGVGMLHETLAQYSALMVMEHEFGREKLRRALEHELDWYLRGRAHERGVEAPLAFAERQDYVYYHKGALAMYALRDAVGEDRLNEALSRFLSSVAFRGPPYTTTAEFLEAIRPVVPEGSRYLVGDLFENITMFDNEVTAATFAERADKKFLVRLDVEIDKLRADDTGAERKIPIDDWIDIAIFGEGENSEGTAPFVERRRIRTSRAAFEIVVDRRPAWVTIDPYYKLIDRDRGDNGRAVLSASAQASR